eukprot:127709-Chlamydomonas_euryale.AAC.1
MLHTCAHAAAYALDPEFWAHVKTHEEDEEVLNGLYEVINRLYSDELVQVRVRTQWSDYQLRQG